VISRPPRKEATVGTGKILKGNHVVSGKKKKRPEESNKGKLIARRQISGDGLFKNG